MISFRRLRRLLMLVASAGIVLCIILLLNFTASNPTGRRYSSESPRTSGLMGEIGLHGEKILSKDLGLPINDLPDQLQCICGMGNPGINECRSCFVRLPQTSTYRRPDFVSPDFIAESKNRRSLLYTKGDFAQLDDYVKAARKLKIPLWVYVRKNTTVDAEYKELVESTGGGIVPYFTVPGYHDPVDRAATWGLIASTVTLVGSVAVERRSRRIPAPKVVRVTSAVDNAETFVEKVRMRAQAEIDIHNLDDPKI